MKEQADIRCWMLRLYAVSWGVIFAGLAYALSRGTVGVALWGIPALLAVACAAGLLYPPLLVRPYRLTEKFLAPVGRIFTLLLLAVVFFGLFTPYALILGLLRWDPLRLRRDRQSGSGWTDVPRAAGKSDYQWQY